MLEREIIEERPSPWGSPCTIVAKSNGSPRSCVDYRYTLNRHIIRKISWRMPNLESYLDAVGTALYISVADILNAFWQLPVAEGHVNRTAVVTPRGKYRFKRMPFGATNTPWLFRQIMSLGLGHLGPNSGILFPYMDDLISINHTFESHLVSLEKMFAALHVAGLTLNPSKFDLGRKKSTVSVMPFPRKVVPSVPTASKRFTTCPRQNTFKT